MKKISIIALFAVLFTLNANVFADEWDNVFNDAIKRNQYFSKCAPGEYDEGGTKIIGVNANNECRIQYFVIQTSADGKINKSVYRDCKFPMDVLKKHTDEADKNFKQKKFYMNDAIFHQYCTQR